ncbi:MAG: hypothetical protein IH897_05430, partial [Planctomycetes bacterium]|nr:hypothetical protein [Planctomycetota bacterium]
MMEPESLAQLAGSGNANTVEKEWLSLVESKDVELSLLRQYDVVLATLRKRGDASVAAELAWAAIETVSSRVSPLETLTVAGPFLLAVGEGDELRKQVADLYRAAYEGREGLEALILEAGLPKGRPVRRALRTLDVCLAIGEGDYLRARDEPTAAKVLSVSPASCEYEIDTGASSETFGAVELADNYHPAAEDDFWVMRQFQRDDLLRRIKSDPASIVIDICKQHDGKISSDSLESMLANDLVADGEWKKWWTRARTALKKYPNIELTGRSPYTIRHHDAPVATDEKLWSDFRRLRDPLDQVKLVEGCLRECKLRGAEVSVEALRQCFGSFVERSERAMAQSRPRAVCFAAGAARIGELAGFDDARSKLDDLLRDDDNLEEAFSQLRTDELYRLACDALISVRSDDWQDRLIDLLPTFPLATCDRTASRLVKAGRSKHDFEEPVQRILTSPVKHYEALLWLWDGPSCNEAADCVIPRNILTRVLRMLEDVRISEKLPREKERVLRSRVRAVLSARKYDRFRRCLDTIDMGVMRALRMQVSRAEGLAVSVRGDMLKELDRRLPAEAGAAPQKPWEREEVLYVTETGLVRKQNEIEHHVNVTMHKNAQAIGRAAEHGDLSENSEYKFALEERDLLRARAAEIKSQMAIARVMRREDVPTEHVSVGAKVKFKHVATDREITLTFLGPWESNV